MAPRCICANARTLMKNANDPACYALVIFRVRGYLARDLFAGVLLATG